MQAGREIKFRAWDKCLEEMRYDITIPSDYTERNGNLDLLNMFQSLGQRYEFMQNTGLRDKNGKEIYEGDILETRHDNGAFYLKVAYDEEYARYWFVDDADNGYCYAPDEFDQDEILVIGNIYEHPELLQAG